MKNKLLCLFLCTLGSLALPSLAATSSAADQPASLWSHDNLLAWCTLPFDAKARGPEERAEMLERLGFTMFAYDWRPPHIPTFDAEIEALEKHHVKLQAWWFPGNPDDPTAKTILEALKRHNAHPQLWVMWGGPFTRTPEEQKQRIDQMAATFQKLSELAKPYGCPVEIYNHNGWGGNEDNELAVIARLKELGVDNVGMVYNFSHAHDRDHDDSANFPELWKRVQSHVVAVNVAGMGAAGNEVFPGQGVSELAMMRTIQESGWHGPVGLIAEQGGDNEVTLGKCIKGLDWLAAELKQPGAGGPKPSFAAADQPAQAPAASADAPRLMTVANPALNLVAGKFGKGLDATSGGLSVLNGKDEVRKGPITVECWVKLRDAANFNLLVASDAKSSGDHWELYSYTVSGCLAAYLPGRSSAADPGEEVSTAVITDNQWHYLAMTLETNHICLYVDGKMVLEDKSLKAPTTVSDPGNIAIGQLVEGGFNANGIIDDVRISKGILPIPSTPPTKPLAKDKSTLYLWSFDKDSTTGL